MTDFDAFPNFFCIGAMRTGSTSLYHYLLQHPDVFMSREKETDFFSLGDLADGELPKKASANRCKNAEAYLQTFKGWSGERAIGEVSPSYLFHARAAIRMHEAAPQAKIVCCLRDPIDRAYSHYSLNRKLDIEPIHNFREALELEGERDDWGHRYAYVGMGRYSEQLDRFYKFFQPEQIHVLFFEDFTRDAVAAVQSIFRFLAVDDAFEPDVSVPYNRSGVLKSPLLRRLGRMRRLRRLLLRNLPPGPMSRLGRLVMRDLPGVEPDVRAHLNDVFADDLRSLETRIDRDLSHWRHPDGPITDNHPTWTTT